jgi:hypothetical protein
VLETNDSIGKNRFTTRNINNGVSFDRPFHYRQSSSRLNNQLQSIILIIHLTSPIIKVKVNKMAIIDIGDYMLFLGLFVLNFHLKQACFSSN